MKKIGLVLTSLLLIGGFAAPSYGQSLGEAARREAERRARIKGAVKVITNADLDALPSRGSMPAAAAPARPDAMLVPDGAGAADAAEPAAVATGAEPPGQAAVRQKRDEQYWRGRAQVIRDRLNGLRSDAAALEGRRDGLRAEVDTASGSQRAVLADQLQRTEDTLARVQTELRLIQDEWRRLEEGALQDKVPLDWIR